MVQFRLGVWVTLQTVFFGAMRSHTKILLCPPPAADPSDCGMLIYHNVSLTLSYLSGTWAEPSRPTDGRCLRPL